MKYIFLGLSALGIVLLLTSGMMLLNFNNHEAQLRTQIQAKQDVNKVVYDNTWKIVQQQAGVTEKYAESFKEIYANLMGERYKDGEAQLAKIVQESNPNFDSHLFERLFDSIEAQRNVFTENQKELRALKQEHDNYIGLNGQQPNQLFAWILGRKEIKVQLVTSTRTENSFQTGKDDDVDLFKKTEPTPTPQPTETPKRTKVDPNKAQSPVILAPPSR